MAKRKNRVKEIDRLTDQMFMTQMMMSFAMIVVCIAMMCTSAFAYFSSTVTSSSNTIRSASYQINVTSTEGVQKDDKGWYELVYMDPNKTAMVIETDESSEEELENEDLTGIQIQTGTYSFVLSKTAESTASAGFAKIEVKWVKDGEESSIEPSVFYTQPIGTFIEEETAMQVNDRVLGIEVPEGYKVYVRITSEWGTCSYPGILTSSAISSLEAPDSVHYVSLITTEDYGVEIIDLEEVLVAVTTNMAETAIETRGLTIEEMTAEIRDMLFVTLDGEEYKDYTLEIEETELNALLIPTDDIVEIPVTIVYPGSDIKLKTEVSTVVYLKHTPLPVLSVFTKNSAENVLETESEEALISGIKDILEVKLDEELISEYEVIFLSEWQLIENETTELTISVQTEFDKEIISQEVTLYVTKKVLSDTESSDDETEDEDSSVLPSESEDSAGETGAEDEDASVPPSETENPDEETGTEDEDASVPSADSETVDEVL